MTDAQGNTTAYVYDSLFGVTEVVYPDSTTEAYTYNKFGKIIQKTEPDGITKFTYNSLYQLMAVSYPDSSVISFAYDANGNRSLMTDPSGETHYVYDERNRLTSETRTINGDPYTVQFMYDAASQVVSIIYPDQTTITREYDWD